MKKVDHPIKAGGLGVDTKHDPSWVVERKKGLQEYLVMCFRNRFITATTDGMKEGRAGNCIIHTPGFPLWHGTPKGLPEGCQGYYFAKTGGDE